MIPSKILKRKLDRIILTSKFTVAVRLKHSLTSIITDNEAPSLDLETGKNGGKKLPLLYRAAFHSKYQKNVAFTDYTGQNFTYKQLAARTLTVANELKRAVNLNGDPKTSAVVGIMCPQDSTFLASLWGCWLAGQTALPLSEKHPENLLKHFLHTCQSKVVLTTSSQLADKLSPIAKNLGFELIHCDFERLGENWENDPIINSVNHDDDHNYNENALILFTSGTTGLPKGVLLTHSNLAAQVGNICTAFDINSSDTMLHVLPLHHTHGLIHALLSPLSVGGRVRMLQKFDAAVVWDTLLSNEESRPSVFMGVPTVYVKLIEEYDLIVGKGSAGQAEFVKKTCSQKMRLMLSGSASLPVPVIEKWERITGHRLLERYGMTEIGVALSNPLKGTRRPGYVGTPFPSVETSIVDMSSNPIKILARGDSTKTEILIKNEGEDHDKITGELLIKGPSVFKEYWNNEEGTRKEFTHDGWFITGDTVQFVEGQGYRILGRKSVDIIKSGGYKLSALEIETQLMAMKEIRELAVLGLDSPTWGQIVAAIIVWQDGMELDLTEFRERAKKFVAPYACPSVIEVVGELPRNHLGKVNKKELAKIFKSKST